MPIDTSKFRDPPVVIRQPFKHQVIGTAALLSHPAFALFDEMGVGKSRQVIDAACNLAGRITTVIVVAPASVRSVWLDSKNGEIKKHSTVPCWVGEFHRKSRMVWMDENPKLAWVVTNYEYLRTHVDELINEIKNRSVMLVCDESSYIKSRTAAQFKAVDKLRQHCSRVVILNGTPVVNSPLDLFSQMKVLDPKILGDNYWAFRAKYCEMVPQRFGKVKFNKVNGYKNLDDLQKRIAPHCLRRLKKDCLDLPEKLWTVREVALSASSWKRYQELKRECLATLPSGDVQIEPNAAVRIMRLAQLTSGHLGTIQTGGVLGEAAIDGVNDVSFPPVCADLSSEKLDWCVNYLVNDCTARYVIVWTRWRRERERLYEMLRAKNILTYQLYGGQSKEERENAVNRFSIISDAVNDALDAVSLRCVLLAQPHAGGHGLNLVAASEAIYLSNDWSLGIRLQSEDRMHRPGQHNPCLYTDVLAVSPKGLPTIDHVILNALRAKESLAALTSAQWRKQLEEE